MDFPKALGFGLPTHIKGDFQGFKRIQEENAIMQQEIRTDANIEHHSTKRLSTDRGQGDTRDIKIPITLTPDFQTYWNPCRYFGLPYRIFIIVGGRGIGKTTGMNFMNLKTYNKNKGEFVILRRYKTELTKIKTAFDTMSNGIITQGLGKGAFEYRFNGKRIGYGLTLAMQSSYKSGMDFSKVKTLVYDEAVLKPNGNLRYLKDEMTELFEIISTIFRDRTDYRVFILGNNLDIFNPYFEYFNIPKFNGIWTDIDRGLYCELCKDKEAFIKKQQETPLAKLTKGTSYYDYHYKNEVLVPEVSNIGVKGVGDKFIFRLVYNSKTINFYFHGEHQLYAELRDKAIVDDYSMVLMSNNKPNYYFIRNFKASDLGNLVKAKHYKKEIICSSPECSSVLGMIMEDIR